MQAGRRMGLVCGVIAAVCVGGVASRASAQCSDLSPAVALVQQRILEPLDDGEQQQMLALLAKLVMHHPRSLST